MWWAPLITKGMRAAHGLDELENHTSRALNDMHGYHTYIFLAGLEKISHAPHHLHHDVDAEARPKPIGNKVMKANQASSCSSESPSPP
jgi:hypothetical protein